MGVRALMNAAVTERAGFMRVVELPAPHPGPGEVIVRVRSVGICGTDVQVHRGELEARLPVVLGHEYAGEVAEVGADVTQVVCGDRVAGAGGWPCDECALCRGRRPGLCSRRRILGRSVQGAFAEYVAVPASTLYRLSPNVSFVAAQAMVTLATAYHALARLGDVRDRAVALIGPGHAGLILLQVLREAGAGPVTVVGTRKDRLARALAFGADAVVAAGAATANGAFDLVVEAAGTPSAICAAVSLARPGGTLLVYGITKEPVDGFPADQLYHKELNVLGSRGAAGAYPIALRALEHRRIRVEPLVTHRFPLVEAPRAIELAMGREENVLRVVLEA